MPIPMARRLDRPSGPVDAVLDTDTFNEIDDQFALAYLLLSPESVRLRAVLAAPFYDEKREFWNYKSESAREGMEKSYDEILRLLDLMGREDFKACVYKGAERFMREEAGPIESPAARELVRLAMEHTPENPLYVIGIAAPTNIASAILLEPAVKERIVVVWMGGASFAWPSCREFNLSQDLSASQVLFDPEVALVQIPGMGVSSAFTVSPQELKHFLEGRNPLSDYLAKNVLLAMDDPNGEKLWTRPIWDVCAAAWLTGEEYVLSRLEKKPMPGERDYDFSHAETEERYVYHINRDALMRDLFAKLTRE